MTGKLDLDPAVVAQARELARLAGQPVTDLARTHTTVSVERAVLRLAGLDGADEDGMPWVNRLADAVRESVGLEHGVALPAWDAMLTGGYSDLRTLADEVVTDRLEGRGLIEDVRVVECVLVRTGSGRRIAATGEDAENRENEIRDQAGPIRRPACAHVLPPHNLD